MRKYPAKVPPSALGLSLPMATIDVELRIGTEGQLWCMTKRGQVTVADSNEAYNFFDKHAACSPEDKASGLRILEGLRSIQRRVT